MTVIHPWVYFDSSIVPASEARLSVASSAVLYGLSVYTVFPVTVSSGGTRYAFRLSDHYKRLCNSAKIIGIDTFQPAWSYEAFEKAVKAVIEKNNPRKSVYVRATVHVDAEVAGTRSRGLSSVLSMFVYDAVPILSAGGVRLKTSVWRRIPDYSIPSRAKVNGAYVNSVLAKQDAIDSGYDDCIFLDVDGHVCELSAANIFIVRDGVVITPASTNDLLEGITRQTVIELARQELSLKVVERAIDLTELYIADEVFASGTSANIAPVLTIDNRTIGDGVVGPITASLQSLHKRVLKGQLSTKRSLVVEL